MRAIVTMALLIGSTAYGGGMVTSGGELLRNSRNPWWVKNTREVSYCVEIDEPSISASRESVEALVSRALEYWKIEFTRKLKLINQRDTVNAFFNNIGVGVQNFAKVSCGGDVKLRFKVGYGTLTEAERTYIPDLPSHISAAVRTEYDEVNLRGRGFVYVASDVGPFSYSGGPDMIEKPWKYEIFLYFALIHELGHVFGLPHIGESYSMMSEGFLEYLLNKTVAEPIKSLNVRGVSLIPFFFFPSSYFANCSALGYNMQVAAYLGLPAGTTCLHFVMDGDNRQILLYATPTTVFNAAALVGTIRDLNLDGDPYLGISLFLTDAQRVFPRSAATYKYMMGPMFIAKYGSANFYPLWGLPKPLFVSLSVRDFALVGWTGASIQTLLKGPTRIFAHY